MPVALVQPREGLASTPNPSLAFTQSVTAGNHLIAVCMQQTASLPGTPTDSVTDLWVSLNGIGQPSSADQVLVAQWTAPGPISAAIAAFGLMA